MSVRKLLASLVILVVSAGCVSIPALQGRPEDIADRIGANAVAYNQAYGRAVADQIVLNTLRARDRLPLYYLSMSGINDTSYVEAETSANIGSIGLGDGNSNWGVASLGASRTNRTIPAFSLNPIGPGNSGRALQFRPLGYQVFEHYWSRGWPRDVLLFTLTDRVTKSRRGRVVARISNSPAGLQEFSAVVAEMADAQNAVIAARCGPSQRPETGCTPHVTIGDITYALDLRSLDDVVYYLGSTLRDPEAGPRVRPPGIYPAQPSGWPNIARTATLFRVAERERGQRSGAFASAVSYNGARYVAGEANSAQCVLSDHERCSALLPGDATSTVLSLLSQLVILSQSEQAQLAPQPATVVAR